MEERDQLLIERYLANELSETERAEVERRQKEDSLFLRELREYEMAMKALQVTKRMELKNRFKALDVTLDSTSSGTKTMRPFNYRWIWLTAVIIVGLVLWKLFFPTAHTSTPESADVKDSLHVEDQPYVLDTATSSEIIEKENSNQDQDKMHQSQQQSKNKKKKGEEIFAENFEPYKDESMSPVSRGEDASPLDKFQRYYWEGNYSKVVDAFTTLKAEHQNNDNLRFEYALSLMAINGIREAQPILQSIIEHHRSIYLDETYWYLGLNYLNQEDFENAKKYFQYCVDSPSGYNKDKAKEILEKIK